MEKKQLANYLDLANHHQEANEEKIKSLCESVLKHGFHSAFVNPFFVPLARRIIGDKAGVGTVVSFPLGQESREIKIASSIWAVKNGASELDISANIGYFKQGKYKETLDEMKAIVDAVKSLIKPPLVKFIIETGLLADDEIKKISELVVLSGADFVKTCSGLGPRGATLKDIELIRGAVGDKVRIKAAGGITNYSQAIDFIKAGVSRIGTSHAVEIISPLDKI